jgi:aldehyde:ferredoxin oxidoreductase
MLPGGYMGKILRVDLTTRRWTTDPLDRTLTEQYWGGHGFGIRLLYDMVDPAVDPLAPENPLIFAVGPFVGTAIPLSGRHSVVAKSPLTGIWGEGDVGGKWGMALKAAGYDVLIVTGAADRPVYLWITEEGTGIRDAGHVWGLDAFEADEVIRRETHPKAVTGTIGVAGERLLPIAAIVFDGHDARMAGRGGLGAVMGAKRLKGIAAHGRCTNPIRDPAGLKQSIKAVAGDIVQRTMALKDFGTAGGVLPSNELGDLPIQNWRGGLWTEGAQRISGQRMTETILKRKYYCGSCIVGCGRVVEVDSTAYGKIAGAGPEYETLAGFGSMVLVDDLEALALANEMANRAGIDTISAGNIAGFAFEAFERGLITTADTDGRELRWGDANAMLWLVHALGTGEPEVSHLLAQGVRRAAAALGNGAEAFAVHVKGMEPPFHDPRAFSSLAVGYATSPNGASHWAATHVIEGKVALPELGYPSQVDRFATVGKGILTSKMQDYIGTFHTLRLCRFLIRIGAKPVLEWYRCVTGRDVDLDELMRVGARMSNLKRLFNVRCGIRRKDDTLPPRLLREPRPEGGAAGYLPDLETMLAEYYDYRGWDADGVPRHDTLVQVGLGHEAADLPSAHRPERPVKEVPSGAAGHQES